MFHRLSFHCSWLNESGTGCDQTVHIVCPGHTLSVSLLSFAQLSGFDIYAIFSRSVTTWLYGDHFGVSPRLLTSREIHRRGFSLENRTFYEAVASGSVVVSDTTGSGRNSSLVTSARPSLTSSSALAGFVANSRNTPGSLAKRDLI